VVAGRHPKIALICLVLTSALIHVSLIAPSVFFILGVALLYSRLLPSVFSYLVLLLGVQLEILEFADRLSFKEKARTYGRSSSVKRSAHGPRNPGRVSHSDV
jgi:hypothetical protein